MDSFIVNPKVLARAHSAGRNSSSRSHKSNKIYDIFKFKSLGPLKSREPLYFVQVVTPLVTGVDVGGFNFGGFAGE